MWSVILLSFGGCNQDEPDLSDQITHLNVMFVHSLFVIIRLMLSVCLCPKVIQLNSFFS